MNGARLLSIVPLGAVPQEVRAAVAPVLKSWGYHWADIALAGTVALPSEGSWHADDLEAWVIAVRADAISVGERFEAGDGRLAGVQASGRLVGVMPATPYPVQVFESLRRPAGGDDPQSTPWPSSDSSTPGPAPVADREQLRS